MVRQLRILFSSASSGVPLGGNSGFSCCSLDKHNRQNRWSLLETPTIEAIDISSSKSGAPADFVSNPFRFGSTTCGYHPLLLVLLLLFSPLPALLDAISSTVYHCRVSRKSLRLGTTLPIETLWSLCKYGRFCSHRKKKQRIIKAQTRRLDCQPKLQNRSDIKIKINTGKVRVHSGK